VTPRSVATIAEQSFWLRVPQNPALPQGTFDDAYKGCLGSLGKSMVPGLAQAADILYVATKTGVDPTLLAVTWRFESEFNFQPTNGMHKKNTDHPGYKERVQNFKDNVKNYDAFFDCLAKKGFSP